MLSAPNSPNTPVLIVVALPPEARPLISHFRLSRLTSEHAFPTYWNRDGNTGLIVSGVGKVNSAVATSHLFNLSQARRALFLNIGIAGHATHATGSPYLIHSVVDSATKKTHYPPILFKADCATAALLCADQPVDNYPTAQLVDMESSGFFSAAARYWTAEFAHSIKVVSDNSQHSWRELSAAGVSELVNGSTDIVDATIYALRKLAGAFDEVQSELPDSFRDVKLSFTQDQQLRELLRRYRALEGDEQSLDKIVGTTSSARDLIAEMQRVTGALPLRFS